MTETQAKSGAAGAATEPTHGSAPPVTETPDQPATPTVGAGGDSASAPDSATTVIRRSPSATSSSATTASGSTSAEETARRDTPARESGPAAPLTFPAAPLPPSAPGAGSASKPPSFPTSLPLSSSQSESSPTTRLSAPPPVAGPVRPDSDATVRTSASARPSVPSGSSPAARGTAAGPATKSAPAPGTVGRAPVVPGTKTSGRPAPGGTSATSAVRGVTGAVTGAAAVGAARVSETLRTARATVAGAATRGPRRARLHLKRIDPWSVMKFSFAVSLVLFVVAVVATSVLYLALDAMNVFDSVNNAFTEITGTTTGEAAPFRITAKGVIGSSILLGAVNMVMFTALSTLGAFVYNVCADLVGGVELTLSEKE